MIVIGRVIVVTVMLMAILIAILHVGVFALGRAIVIQQAVGFSRRWVVTTVRIGGLPCRALFAGWGIFRHAERNRRGVITPQAVQHVSQPAEEIVEKAERGGAHQAIQPLHQPIKKAFERRSRGLVRSGLVIVHRVSPARKRLPTHQLFSFQL